MTKKLVSEYLTSFESLEYRRVSSVVKELQELLDKYGDNLVFENIRDPWEDYETTHIYLERLETDEEYANRIQRENVLAEQQKEYDLQLLAKLQAKYAGGNN